MFKLIKIPAVAKIINYNDTTYFPLRYEDYRASILSYSSLYGLNMAQMLEF